MRYSERSERDKQQRREASLRYLKRHPDKAREAKRRYRQQHPDIGRKASLRYRNRHPEIDRGRKQRIKYGITPEQYDLMLKVQGGQCAICKTDDPGRSKFFCVDHDHGTGAVRGLLCTYCNIALGFFKDDVNRLEAAVQYCQRSNAIMH